MFRHCMLYALVMFLASCLLPVTARAAEDPLKYEGLRGQYVNAMALVPDGRVMVATNAGVWEFAKNGAPVSLLPDTGMPRKMEECAIEQVVVNSKGNVFIAVGPNKGSPSLRGGDGVFRMDPKNARWTQVGKDVLLQAKSETIQSVAVLPDDTLFCVVKGVKAKDGDLSCFKLFRSTNNGDTWQYLLPPDPARFFGISIVPGPNRQLWLSTSGVHQSANRVSFSSWIGIADDWQATPLKWHVNSLQSGDHKIGT
ncbi:MAG: hypothetical protein WCJ97_11310, partial [Phycisphaerae bacterium]